VKPIVPGVILSAIVVKMKESHLYLPHAVRTSRNDEAVRILPEPLYLSPTHQVDSK